MSSSPKESSFAAKKEDGAEDDAKIPQGVVCSSRSSWQGMKDPRIVRVSRSFGGKDRHSKVRTIKGLRDRRVRLSVQTAIQLYDLQDRLGLSQPSKAVDWLLSAAEHEINKLPPLPMPPEFFRQYPQPDSLPGADIEQMMRSQRIMRPSSSATDQGNTRSSAEEISEEQTASYSNSKQWMMSWCRRATGVEKNDWMEGNGQENKEPNEAPSASDPAIVPLPPHNYYSPIPNTCYSHWNFHPNASNILSTGHGCSSQSSGESHNFTTGTPLSPPSFSLPFGSQLIFPNSHLSMSADSDLKHTSQIQMLGSSSQHLFPNSSINPSLYSTPNRDTRASSSLFLNQR